MNTSQSALWAERTGTNTYTGRSSTGAEVKIGPRGADGTFTPSDLFAMGLAACNLMSADRALARALGDDFDAYVGVQTTAVAGQNRYSRGEVEIVVNMEALDEDERATLIDLVHKAVDRGCTVGRTLDKGMPQTLRVTSEG
ncbi:MULTISPECIES: OsmC family protein [unclassified Pseudactinotalea]|uniref:OsmC family protein n=1 Tax=Micrococcales TaxID=85006 RepID=UPI003C7BF248